MKNDIRLRINFMYIYYIYFFFIKFFGFYKSFEVVNDEVEESF